MKKLSVLLFYVFILLIFAPAKFVVAQKPNLPPAIPPTDNDIERVIQHTRAFAEFARQCSSSDCPNFDCKEAQQAFIRLSDAREHLRLLHFWLKQSSSYKREHLEERIKEGSRTAERLVKVQKIVAYQEYVINIANTMLDITSAAANLKDISNNEKKWKEMSGAELAQHLDTLYEGLKDIENIQRTMKSGLTPDNDLQPKTFSMGSDELDNYKSTLSNLKSIVQEYKNNGKDWRKAFNSKNGRMALGAIVGRIAKTYADSEIQERKKHIKTLIDDLKKSDRIQTIAYEDFIRTQERRNKAEIALRAIEKLLVVESDGAGGTLTRCFLKSKNACPVLNVNYISKLVVPNEYKTFDPKVSDSLKIKSGEALRYFNQKLPTVEKLLRPVPKLEWETDPTLTLSRRSYNSNDVIKVKFNAPRCYPSNSWAGIVPSSVPHGSEQINHGKIIGLQNFLRGRSEGEFFFNAPKESGSYDIRLNDAASGREVKSITFTVSANTGNLELEVIDALSKPKNTHITIYQNGKEVVGSWTEYSPYKLPPGIYEVKFDYALGIRRTVQIKAGEITKEVVQDVSGRLRLEVFDAAGQLKDTHVTIYRGEKEVVGTWTAYTPIDLPPGVYKVKFSIGEGITRSVIVVRGQTVRLWLLDS